MSLIFICYIIGTIKYAKSRSLPGTSSLDLWSKKVSQSRADCAINRSSSRDPSAKCTLNTSVDVTAGLEKHHFGIYSVRFT